MLKRLSMWLLILMVAIGSFGTGFAERRTDTSSFSDVQDQYWASDAIKGLVRDGIMSGYPDGTFGPDKSITREQFAVILVNAFDLKTTASSTPIFKDVPTNRWSYGYIDGAKDYLTGYFYKNGSKPTFDPEGAATREDVAVALVKAMGLENEKIDGENYLDNKFDDIDSISPKLRDQVAIAVKFGLMSGFPNDTFKGDATINRASTAALFYKAMKSPYFKGLTDLKLNVSMPEKSSSSTVNFSGTTTSDGTLTINDTKYTTVNGRFSGSMYLDKGTGTYTYVFKVTTADGRTKSVTKTVLYATTAPVISLNNVPEVAAAQYLNLTGKVNKPDGSYPRVYVNDIETRVYTDGSFNANVKLNEGDNTLTIKVTSLSGLSTILTKKVSYNVTGPVLTFYSAPETSAVNSVSFSGRVKSTDNRSSKLTVNDAAVTLSYFGEFNLKADLKEGDNLFVFKATDSTGKITTITKKVVFTAAIPVINLGTVPETTSELQVVIKGSVVDSSDRSPKLWINDLPVSLSSGGEFTYTVVLKEGSNVVTFKAQNSSGKVASVSKTIKMVLGSPVLKVTSALESSKVIYQLKGLLTDPSYAVEKDRLYVNGKSVVVASNGEWSLDVTLNEGKNTLTLEAQNAGGKTASLQLQVTFTAPDPTLYASVAETSTVDSVQISGNVSDINDDKPVVTVNGVKVFVNDSRNWNYTVKLVAGDNKITVTAQNSYGKITKIEKTVKYTAPVVVPNPAPAPAPAPTPTPALGV